MKNSTAYDTVFIRGLTAESVIGVYDWEREITQRLVLDVELYTDFAEAEVSDSICDALDYAEISQRIIDETKLVSFQLLEALAGHITKVILAEFRVVGLKLVITKPGAVPEAEGVGVVVERFRSNV